MGAGDNLLLKLDETVTQTLSEWDIYTTSIAAVIVAIFAYQVFTRRDPDVHPMLLARQSQASPVRNQGESAVFRSHGAPHGMTLNSGLNVKDPGASRWSRGRDGDLRDVWRRVVNGPNDDDGKASGVRGRLLTVLGTERIIEHDLGTVFQNRMILLTNSTPHVDEVTQVINIIGQCIKQNGGQRVAIYLPNSVELLATIFAGAFNGFTPILLPYDQSSAAISSMLQESEADTLVASAGSIPFEDVTKGHPALQQLIWVADGGSAHMDWNEIPRGAGGNVNVATWQDIVDEHKAIVSKELPSTEAKDAPKDLIAFWPSSNKPELVAYTQANITSAISGQLSSIPTSQKFGPADLFLPADSLSSVYPLVLTFAALYFNSSVALNSVAGTNPNLTAATQGIAPTIIVASAATLSQIHTETASKLSSAFYRTVHWLQTRTLTQDGVMPLSSIITKFNDSLRPIIGTTPGKLRLVFVSEQAGTITPPLSSTTLSDLRIFTGARVIYALTAAKVAGAVTQTGFYDYRIEETGKQSHFGAPVTSVEIFLKDTKDLKTSDEAAAGEVSLWTLSRED